MLSLGKIKLNGESYYLDAVADGIDEYYRGVGEAPGRWSGAAAEGLGLEGEVAAEELHAVWAGLDPATGEQLGPVRRPRGGAVRPVLPGPEVRVAAGRPR